MRCIQGLFSGWRRLEGCSRGLAVLVALALLTGVLGVGRPLAGAEPPAAPAQANPEAVALDQKLIAEAKNGSEILANLTYLSDVIGPRLTGSANLKRANEWAAEKMKSYGLTNVHLEAWEMPVGWERGAATARIVEPDNGRSLTVAAMGWTPGTNGKFVGDVVVINARTPEELKAYEGKLKNAIVLRGAPANVRPITDMSMNFGGPPDRRPANPGDPAAGSDKPPTAQPDKPPSGEKPPAAQPDKPAVKSDKPATPDKPAAPDKPADAAGAPAKTEQPATRPPGFDNRGFGEMMRFRREMAEFLRKEGVAVMLTDAAKPHGLLDMTGAWASRDRAGAPDPLPTLFVIHEHYALLHRLATRPAPAQTRLELEITNTFIPGPLAVYNTVGEIRGSDKPDEFVVVGAHLDSWDLGQGTTDNGTGTCVVLETARLLAKSPVRPKRTIRFVLFTGEEQGLHGSKAYVSQHKDELPKTSAAIVHDTGTGKITGLALQGREVIKPIMEGELASLKDLGVTDISLRSMGGSDHMSFDGAGVPGFMFRQDPAEYRLTHHSQSDTLDKAKEPELIQGAQVMAVLATRVANRDDMLPRDKKAPAPATTPVEAQKPDK
jgi:carboxypeptidase Q